jgi:chromosome segregation ATPase
VIRTETDLRELEKLAYEYELAYRHSYNGAKAMHFKSLYEPILVKAGDRRDAIRAEEDRLAAAQKEFYQRLDDIDVAWRMTLGSDEDVLRKIQENEASVVSCEQEIETLQARKVQLAEDAWNGPSGTLDQKCLEEIGVVEADIKKCGASIEKYERNIEIIKLACRLQRGEEPVAEVVVVEQPETEAAEAEAIEAEAIEAEELL